LPGNSQRVNEKRREIGPRPNAKTRNGDEWHKFLLPPEYLYCGLTVKVRDDHIVATFAFGCSGVYEVSSPKSPRASGKQQYVNYAR
jgi:hypothetical protein